MFSFEADGMCLASAVSQRIPLYIGDHRQSEPTVLTLFHAVGELSSLTCRLASIPIKGCYL